MTRWDCDVKLWRGVPCHPPAFYGWPSRLEGSGSGSGSDKHNDLVRSSTSCARYVCCPTCHQWVLYQARCRKCGVSAEPKEPKPPKKTEELEERRESSDTYVIATDENSTSHVCWLCTDRMHLEYLHDIEEWIFKDCVEHEGEVVHAFCRNCIDGATAR